VALMPTRIIRDGILTSEPVDQLSWAEEVFYRRLQSVVDDYGRFYAHPSLILAACYPLKLKKVSDSDVEKWLAACVTAALVRVYLAKDGKRYLEIQKFGQRIQQVKSKFLGPEDEVTANNGDPPKVTVENGVVGVGVVVQEKHVRQAARFHEFWKAMPARRGTSKPNRKGCEAKWKARNLDNLADVILADVDLRKRTDTRWTEGFPPDPMTYLNQDRWADDKPEAAKPVAATNPGGTSPAKQETAEDRAAAAKAHAEYVAQFGYGP
jgi:hypothetical protein